MLEPGRVVERYTVEGELGAGGMATVFLVRHNALGSLHALKLLKVQNREIAKRLMHEGRIQATLRHPNIVTVTDVIEVDGSPGLVLEYIAGPTLEHWLQQNTPSLALAESLFRAILAGVARAHREGLVHRDLKPGNVLLDEGDEGLVPKVTDFGLVKILVDDASTSQTRSGIAMGTPAYMAPEQIRDAKNVDRRADVFALGCILYELVCGRPPFAGSDVLAIFNAIAEGDYPPPEGVVSGLPPRIVAAIRGCLEVDRELRIADCSHLREVLTGPPLLPPAPENTESYPPPVAKPGWRPSLRTGIAAFTSAFVVALFVGGLGAAVVAAWWAAGAMPDDVPATPETVPPRLAEVRPEGGEAEQHPAAPVSAPLALPAPVAVPPRSSPRVAPPTSAAAEPAPVAAAAEPATAAASDVLLGAVVVTGAAEQVWFERASITYPPGPLPPGIYKIRARFSGQGEDVDAGHVAVRAGVSVSVVCVDGIFMCREER